MVADGKALDEIDADVLEVHRLLNQTQRAIAREHLHGLLGELSERKRGVIQAGFAASWPPQALANSFLPPPPPPLGNSAALSFGTASSPNHHQPGSSGSFTGNSSISEALPALSSIGGAPERDIHHQDSASDPRRPSGGLSNQGTTSLSFAFAGLGVAEEPAGSPYDLAWPGSMEDSHHSGSLTLRGGAGMGVDMNSFSSGHAQAYPQHQHTLRRSISADPQNMGSLHGTYSLFQPNLQISSSQQYFMQHGRPPPPPPGVPMSTHHSSMGGSRGGPALGTQNGLHTPDLQATSSYSSHLNDQLHGPSTFPGPQYGSNLSQFPTVELAALSFRPLTTYSWEQSTMFVKIYVPLRGVQTDMLRVSFTHMGLEVRVLGLQARNYVFSVQTLNRPINTDNCHVAASKTKKNILITLQKLHWDTAEEKHWRDLHMPGI